MRKIYFTMIFLFVIIVGFTSISSDLFTNPSKIETVSTTSTYPSGLPISGFTNMIHNAHPKTPISFRYSNIIQRMSEDLHFNATNTGDQRYGVDSSGEIGQQLKTTQIEYANFITGKLASYGMNYIMQRAKINTPCYGQRCVYEVLDGNVQLTNSDIDPLNDGFVYQNCYGSYFTDSDRTVLHLTAGNDDEGFIAENIFENMQQIDFPYFLGDSSDIRKWYLKPMIRIKTSDFNDSNKLNDVVINIEIHDFKDGIVSTLPILVKDFKVDNNNTTYHGEYTEKFNVDPEYLTFTGPDLERGINRKAADKWEADCKVDFKIDWPGNVDIWFDKLTVDDLDANKLFNGKYDGEILEEADASNGNPLKLTDNLLYGMDELTYSNISCIKYVQDKYKELRLDHHDLKMDFAPNQWMFYQGLKNKNIGIKTFLKTCKPIMIHLDIEPIQQAYPENLHLTGYSANPHVHLEQQITGETESSYNTKLQERLGSSFGSSPLPEGSFLNQIQYVRDVLRNNSGTENSYFVVQPQLQAFMLYGQDNYSHEWFWGPQREPTNEEIQTQAMLALAHGADGLDWWWIPSLNEDYLDTNAAVTYGLGSIHPTNYTYFVPRDSNMFGQNKYTYVASMNLKLMNWKPWLDRIKWQAGYSIHENESGTFSRYISDLKSILTYYSANENTYLPITSVDAAGSRYWEIGYFDADPTNTLNTNDHSKYFLLSNRRCYPTNDNHAEGIRIAQLKFNKDNLPGFNNWRITDVNTGASVTFNKNTSNGSYVSLGTSSSSIGFFNPGEGKLFRLQPVMETGGTLEGNEVVIGTTFNCMNMVYNNGYNITAVGHNTINFDSAAGIKLNGGKLYLGNFDENPTIMTLKGLNSKKWMGITCDSCSIAYISQLEMKDLKDTGTFLSINNTDTLICTDCSFYGTSSSGNHPNGVSVTANNKLTHNNFTNCAFDMSYSADHTISVISSGSQIGNVFVNYMTDNSNGGSGQTGILMSHCEGIIKNSKIKDFMNSITAIASDVHLFRNEFLGSGQSVLIDGVAEANYYLGSDDRVVSTGWNKFDYHDYSTSMKDIHVDASTFYIYRGNNLFYVQNDVGNAFHFEGVFNSSPLTANYTELILASGNCFFLDESGNTPTPDYPVYDLTDNGHNPMTVDYRPSSICENYEDKELLFVTDLGNGIFDTIYFDGEGYGGGISSKNEIMNVSEISSGKLHSAIELYYRKELTDSIYNCCYQYLNNYFDSTWSSNTVSRLYSSALELDKKAPLQTGSRIAQLKAYYEGLILSHSENEKMVKMLFYYIQKAKIALKDYEGAMTGLQEIINQNPYSYEGLIASWDYMSAYLQSAGGSGGGDKGGDLNDEIIRQNEINCDEDQTDLLINDDPLTKSKTPDIHDDFDKTKFNEGQRQQITKSIVTAFTKTKKTDLNEMKKLKSDSDNGNKKARQQLEEKRILNETVKIKRPANNDQMIKILNSDIKKVFHKGNNTDGNDIKKPVSIIPLEYKLNQNYPNPFNPVTKISFELPNDAKMNLIVYDVLGREVSRLINDETRQAGKYIMEFNGQAFASGVYFYRIEAHGSGQPFVQVKKMVLVK
ncbi:hypothetical protein BH10BAC5_BH10BAC5_12880 [soil metagenome]